MDLLELQQRANQLVSKVNNYEASLDKYEIPETDILAEHKYADLYTLRAVMNLLFGSDADKKCDRSLNIPTDLRLFASTVPMWNTTFNLIPRVVSQQTIYTGFNPIVTSTIPYTDPRYQPNQFPCSDNWLRVKYADKPGVLKEAVLVFTPQNVTRRSELIIDDQSRIYLTINGARNFTAYSSVEGRDVVVISSPDLSGSTTYYIKIERNYLNETQDRIDYFQSTDKGASWTFLKSLVQNTNYSSQSNIDIMDSNGNSDHFQGTFDATQSYLVFDNDTTKKQYIYGEFEELGLYHNLKNKNSGVSVNSFGEASGFTSSNYLYIDGLYYDDYNDWYLNNMVDPTVELEFTLTSEVTSKQRLVSLTGLIEVNILDMNTISLWNWGQSTWTTIISEPLELNKTYRLKVAISNSNTRISTYKYNFATNEYEVTNDNVLFSTASDKYQPIVIGAYYNGNDPFTQGIINLINTKINNIPMYYLQEAPVSTYDVKSDKHEFISNIDTLNNFNLIQLDALTNTVTTRDQRVQCGINYSYSSNIADALATECQVANLFKWNTTDPDDIPNNTITLNRQVPGVVLYYLGPEYFEQHLPTISYNPTQSKFNAVSYNNPPYWGSFYDTTRLTELDKPAMYSQWNSDMLNMWGDTATCKMFMPGMFYSRGKLISPQQIWQPATKYGEENRNYGYNCQGSAAYHELVFKNRRQGLETVVTTEEVFDQSKFNIIGSPTITNDGIASGFSSSSYVKVTNVDLSGLFHIKQKYTTNATLDAAQMIMSTATTRGFVLATDNNILWLLLSSDGSNFDIANKRSTLTLSPNTTYDIDLYFDGSKYYVDINGTNYIEVTSSLKIYNAQSRDIDLGFWFSNSNAYQKGSIDLKQFLVIVNDEVIFKGTKEVKAEIQTDFIPALPEIPDNDPQGLATRAVLAQQKEFYTGRLWFNELDSLNGADMTKFATAINQASRVRESLGDVDPNKFRLINDVSLLPTGVVSNYNTDKYLYADIDVLNTNQNIEVSLPLINYSESSGTGIWYGFYEAGTAGNPRYRIYISSVASTTNMFQYTIDYINESGSITTTTGTIDEAATDPVTTSDTLDFKMTINRQILNFYINGNKVGENITLNADTNLAPSFMIGRVESSNNSININPLRILANGIETFTSHAVSETYMTDDEFYRNFKLDYNTYADGLNQPK